MVDHRVPVGGSKLFGVALHIDWSGNMKISLRWLHTVGVGHCVSTHCYFPGCCQQHMLGFVGGDTGSSSCSCPRDLDASSYHH